MLPCAVREANYRYGAVLQAEGAFVRVSTTRLALASHGLGRLAARGCGRGP